MSKTDCFAYIREGNCAALTSMICKQKECRFYKTREKVLEDRERREKKDCADKIR